MKTDKINIGYPCEPPYLVGVGDKVWDDLTSKIDIIERITRNPGQTPGVWLKDKSWMGGGRHPWEISPPSFRTK